MRDLRRAGAPAGRTCSLPPIRRNPYGAALAWPRRDEADRRPFQRAAGAYVVLVDGAPVLYLERGGSGLVTFPAAADLDRLGVALAALRVLVLDGRVRELVIGRVDGEPVGPAGPWRDRLLAAGFVSGYRGMALRPTTGRGPDMLAGVER